MKKRSLVAVFVLSIVTFGIYNIYWYAKTKGEMVALGAEIPTTWLIIVPFVSIWWLYKYSMGVDKVTEGKLQGILTFIMLWFIGAVGTVIVQDFFNKIPATGPIDGAIAAGAEAPAIPAATEGADGAEPASDAAPASEAPATDAPAAETPAPATPTAEGDKPADTPPTNPVQ